MSIDLRLIASPLAACLSALCATAASADDGWSFRLTPYAWVPWVDTDLDIGPNPPVSGSTSLLDVLDGALLLTGEARYGDFGLLAEFNYLNLSHGASTPGGVLSADIGLKGVMASVAGAWRIAETDRTRADAFAGLRYWNLDASIDFRLLGSVSREKSWTDPLIGLRVGHDLTDRLSVEAMGDIGGFGVGSDIQWEAVTRVGYRVSERATLALGYRHVYLDFDDDGLVLDVQLTGPLVAVDVFF